MNYDKYDHEYERVIEALTRTCPYLKNVVQQYGMPAPKYRSPGYSSLLKIILSQQISVAASLSIWKRLESGLENISATSILDAGPEKLSECGVSQRKIKYAISLAKAVKSDLLNFSRLALLNDNEAIVCLTNISGIGIWTAEIYLIFCLNRQDIWPDGDLALTNGLRTLFSLRDRPDRKKIIEISDRWRPWRSLAAVLVWHFYNKEK